MSVFGEEYKRKDGLPRVEALFSPGVSTSPLETLEQYAVRKGPMSVVMAFDDDANRRGHPPFVGGVSWSRAVNKWRDAVDNGEEFSVTKIGNGPMGWARSFTMFEPFTSFDGEQCCN